MYKQTILSHQIAAAEDFSTLLGAIKEYGPIISYSRPQPIEHSHLYCIRQIKRVLAGGPINLITRAEGLRAKVAELVLAKNYGDPLPKELQ
jgi:hypothetical protein